VKGKTTDFWVGLFVVAGVAALLFLALRAGNLESVTLGEHMYSIKGKFDNIGGLKTRAPVRSAGVSVGRVSHIDFDNKMFQAVVTIQIKDGLQFPKDTSAKILTSGLLGEQYVGLDPGGDSKMLVAGDQIESTQSAVVLENLISQFLFSKAADPSGSSSAPATSAPAVTK
jgi:phospholipid/cholesterol/gamma-HCH transport system substrate-binding protein